MYENSIPYVSSTQVPMVHVNTVKSFKFVMAKFLWISWASLHRNFINNL